MLLARRLATALPGPRPFAVVVGATLAAQVGVAPAAWLLFGPQAVWSLVANVLAEPLAAFVMTYGLPSGLLAGLVPHGVGAVPWAVA